MDNLPIGYIGLNPIPVINSLSMFFYFLYILYSQRLYFLSIFTMPETTYHKPLNKYQLRLLSSVYKFRFVSSGLLALSYGSTNRVINSRLKILLDQEYIGRNYDSSYKLRGKQASYYLLPNGIRIISKQNYSHPKVINSLYRDKRAKEDFINHQLQVFKAYTQFKRLYRDMFNWYSRSELKRFQEAELMPEKLPDAYIRRIKPIKAANAPNDLFLDYYDKDTPMYKHVARIKKYITYLEESGWDDEHSPITETPTIILVCETKELQRRLVRRIHREMETCYEDIIYWLTSLETLATASDTIKLWQIIDSDED